MKVDILTRLGSTQRISYLLNILRHGHVFCHLISSHVTDMATPKMIESIHNQPTGHSHLLILSLPAPLLPQILLQVLSVKNHPHHQRTQRTNGNIFTILQIFNQHGKSIATRTRVLKEMRHRIIGKVLNLNLVVDGFAHVTELVATLVGNIMMAYCR